MLYQWFGGGDRGKGVNEFGGVGDNLPRAYTEKKLIRYQFFLH